MGSMNMSQVKTQCARQLSPCKSAACCVWLLCVSVSTDAKGNVNMAELKEKVRGVLFYVWFHAC